jgi:hypothetical protein
MLLKLTSAHMGSNRTAHLSVTADWFASCLLAKPT